MEAKSTQPRTYQIGLIALVFIAFISLGLPDGLLGVAWPSIHTGFGIPLDSLGMLLYACTAGYMSSSFFSGKIISKLGVGGTLAASCGLTGLALIGYTLVPVWCMMVFLGIFGGLGAGAIDAGLNTYAAANFKERAMQWMHGCYGIGVTLGPIIMATGLNLYGDWHIGYRVVGAAQLLLGFAFLFSLKMWKRNAEARKVEGQKQITDYKTSFRETLRQGGAWLSVALFFIYTGCEAALGTWVFTLLTGSRHISAEIAGYLTSSYWVSFTIGRFLAGWYTKRLGLKRVLSIAILGALFGAILLLINVSSIVSIVGVAIIGFAIAPIFPALMSGTASRVSPRHTANTIGMQMAGAGLGAATIPAVIGILAQNISLEAIAVSMVVLYAVLFLLHLSSVKNAASEQTSTTPLLEAGLSEQVKLDK
jgi:fucose permease